MVPSAKITSDLIFVFSNLTQNGIDSDNSSEQTIDVIDSQRQGSWVSCNGRTKFHSGRDKGVAINRVNASTIEAAMAPVANRFA